MMKQAGVVLLFAFLAGCASPPAAPTPDVGAIYTQAAQTVVAGLPTKTPLPPATATTAPTTTAAALEDNVFGWNYLASQDSGGVTIQIARLLLANKADLPASLQLDQAKSLDELIIRIKEAILLCLETEDYSRVSSFIGVQVVEVETC